MRRELLAGLVLGGTLGFVGFLRITVWSLVSPAAYGPHWPLVAVTIWLSLVDVTGIVIYFEVAARVLRGTLL